MESARLFLIQEKVSDYAGMYVPGTYALSSEMTTEEIMRVISGKEPSPYELPEEAAAAGEQPAEEPAQEQPAQEEQADEEPAEEESEEESEEEPEGEEEE